MVFKQFAEAGLHIVKVTANFIESASTQLLLCQKSEGSPSSERFLQILD